MNAPLVLVQAQFREMEGGYHRANVELKAYLRDGWVLPALPVLVEESAAALGEGASEGARWEHARLCESVGEVLRQNRKLGSALAHFEMDLEIGLALEGPEGFGVAGCYQNMGIVHGEMGENDRALELYGQAAAIYDEIVEHWTIVVGGEHAAVKARKADAARVRAALARR